MTKFWSSVGLCLSLLLAGLFVFHPASQAQNNFLAQLIELPAPAPPNPLVDFRPRERDEDFYKKEKPPADDAPIEDLLDYWRHQSQYDPKFLYTVKPSEKTLARLFAEIEKKPETLTGFLRTLPETDEARDFVKKLYENEISAKNLGRPWREEVKSWLTYNSDLFSEELLRTAQQATDTEGYVTHQDEVLALARVDWEKARPLLDKMIADPAQPVSQTLARWAYYQRALETKDAAEIEKYRRELQETVENKNLQPGNRDLAMDALVTGGDFAGRDDWYLSLLDDETLHELRVGGQIYTGLTTIINHSPSEKYIEKMIEIVRSGSPAARNAAARNLSTMLNTTKNPEIVKALLPWLENPKWAKEVEGERRRLVEALRHHSIPESVPGLIAALSEKQTVDAPSMSNTNAAVTSVYASNAAVGNTAVAAQSYEYFPFRSQAIQALEKQRDARAASALRQILPEVESWERQSVVRALLASNGFAVAEQIEALEKIAQMMPPTDTTTVSNAAVTTNVTIVDVDTTQIGGNSTSRAVNASVPAFDPAEWQMILGFQLIAGEYVGSELVDALVERIDYLDAKDPSLALSLRRVMRNWKGPAVYSLLLRDLKNGKTDLEAAIVLLANRKEIREKQLEEIYDARAGRAEAVGIAACLLEDAGVYDSILDGRDAVAQTALLGCARLTRAPLAVARVAEHLRSADPLLAAAAERYLEAEDSSEARRHVLAANPNKSKILGARFSFATAAQTVGATENLQTLFASVNPLYRYLPPFYYYSGTVAEISKVEQNLQKEIQTDEKLIGVYAYGAHFIRIYGDRAVYSFEDDPARYRERELSAEEFGAFQTFIANQNADELTAFLSPCENCAATELLMLGRAGGRRVFVRADPQPAFFAALDEIFASMQRPPARLRYKLEKKIPNLEILWADEALAARNVWKNGADFRLLIEDRPRGRQIENEIEEMQAAAENEIGPDGESEADEEKRLIETERKFQKMIEQKKFEHFAWHRFAAGRLGDATLQPASIAEIAPRDAHPVAAAPQAWKAKTANIEIRASEEGLFKISGGRLTRIRSGYFDRPVVSANGRWALAARYGGDSEEDSYGAQLIRVNVLTGREFPVKIKRLPMYEPLAFLPAIGKFLVFGGYYSESEDAAARTGEYFLLDAETGFLQPAKGEFRPLIQQSVRALQAAAEPDQFWAAIPDREKNQTSVGLYNARTMTFKTILEIPEILFDSMKMWVDETENKLYFVYEGQLLALPLAKAQK